MLPSSIHGNIQKANEGGQERHISITLLLLTEQVYKLQATGILIFQKRNMKHMG